MKQPATRKIIPLKMVGLEKLTPSITSHFCGSLTESLQIQGEWKQHMCFAHAHHENTSSIKINFKFPTVLLLQTTLQLQVTSFFPANPKMGVK